MLRFPCPSCGKILKAPEEYAGKKGKCSACGFHAPIPKPVEVHYSDTLSPHKEEAPDFSDFMPEEDVPPPFTYHQPSKKPSPLRFLSPSLLALTALCFFLPWVEVQCNGKVMATQSGFQTIYGGMSTPGLMENTVNQMKSQLPPEVVQQAESQQKTPDPAVLVALAFVVIVLGGITALGLPQSSTRTIFVGGCAGAALLFLALQAAIGFPIENNMAETMAQNAMKNGGKGMESALMGSAMIEIHCSLWFWLTLFLLLATVGSAFAEKSLSRTRAD
jgi:DNA-directed RNA polymerase subunit M/transcription elongation factor TFIIS